MNKSTNIMADYRQLKDIKNKWFEVPRTILKAIAEASGATFVEFYRTMEESFCCGAGGGVRSQYGDFSLKTASLRLDEAEAIKADIVTTECPFCWRNLTDANDKFKHGLKVWGILEMLDQLDLVEVVNPIEEISVEVQE
jgi:Fe-S oxidoreductase